MTTRSPTTGYIFAIIAFAIFATQDAISKHLSDHYPPLMIAMIRYWFFAMFAIALTARWKGGLRQGLATKRPILQIFRSVLLALQVAGAMASFRIAGLVTSEVLFAATPLLVAMLSGPVLGEHVGWRRWTAIIIGLCGVLVIIKPDPSGFDSSVVVPLVSAVMSAVYSISTRLASRTDTAATSFLYTGICGVVVLTTIGPFFWTPIAGMDWFWVGLVCITSSISHFCLIKSFDYLDAAMVQPFNYFQMVLAAIYGIIIFQETLKPNVLAGSAIVVAAGGFTIWREVMLHRKSRLAPQSRIEG